MCQIELDWDYVKGQVHLSMVPYLEKALHQFDIFLPLSKQYAFYLHTPPQHGAKTEYTSKDNALAAGHDAD